VPVRRVPLVNVATAPGLKVSLPSTEELDVDVNRDVVVLTSSRK
jgi:hypothetical protein